MDVRIKFLKPFVDGNIFSEKMKMYQEVIVDENKLGQIKNSGAEIEILGRIIPPHKKSTDKV